MVYKGYKSLFNFKKFKTIWSFGDAIWTNVIMMDMANDEQNQLA